MGGILDIGRGVGILDIVGRVLGDKDIGIGILVWGGGGICCKGAVSPITNIPVHSQLGTL
jgi:hypothetical protein